MKLRRLKLPALIIIGALLLSGQSGWCSDVFGKPENYPKSFRAIIILVDMSGSTNQARRTIYREAFEKIYQTLGLGDRIMVGTITSRSYIDFKPAVDAEIPKQSIWDNRLQFERNLSNTRGNVRKEVNKLLSRKQGSPLTEILNSLNIADTIFHEEKQRQKILVVLSDMIQDSKEYKFDKDNITDAYVDAVIRQRQGNNLMPNLTGVKVYVAGASAADSNKFHSIQTFWSRYFTESGADFSPHRYGHSLINFGNGS